MSPMPVCPTPKGDGTHARQRHALIAYFQSGWAFLLPYVLGYILYSWLGWPATGRAGALVQVFWALHLLHAALAAWALTVLARSWEWAGIARAALPWAALGLLLFLPGAYLEFPSDAWEHLRRIRVWEHTAAISAHPEPSKMGYFFIYSVVLWLPDQLQGLGLSAYVASAGLALSWISYRLGRVLGLGRNGAFVAALLQPLLAGNNLFSFSRYYGLSSTPWSQLAALALVTIVVRVLRAPRRLETSWRTDLASVAGLLAIIWWNHKQGLAIAGLAALCAVAGKVAERGRGVLFLGIAAAVTGLAAYCLAPASSVQPLVQAGWLNSWFGFNLLDPSSLAFARALQLLGLVGVVNICAGLLLVAHRPLLAALTVGPVLILLHPAAGWLVGSALAGNSPAGVSVYHRLFMAIPAGFACVGVGSRLLRPAMHTAGAGAITSLTGTALVALLVCVPPSAPGFNRFWHAVARVPRDLSLRQLDHDIQTYARLPVRTSPELVVGPAAAVFVLETIQERRTPFSPIYEHRLYGYPHRRSPAGDLAVIDAYLQNPGVPELILLQPRGSAFFTPGSSAAFLSKHWGPQEVALAAAGAQELARQRPAQEESTQPPSILIRRLVR